MRYAPSRAIHVPQSFPRTTVCPSQNKFAIPRRRVPSDVRARRARPRISAALESLREFPALALHSNLALKLFRFVSQYSLLVRRHFLAPPQPIRAMRQNMELIFSPP